MKNREKIFLEHIMESIEDIETFVNGVSKNNFLKNKEKQNALIRSIEIIGEATKNLPLDFRRKHSLIPWKKIAGMRDRLTHHYFGVDFTRVWNVIKDDIPKLKKQIKEILKAEE